MNRTQVLNILLLTWLLFNYWGKWHIREVTWPRSHQMCMRSKSLVLPDKLIRPDLCHISSPQGRWPIFIKEIWFLAKYDSPQEPAFLDYLWKVAKKLTMLGILWKKLLAMQIYKLEIQGAFILFCPHTYLESFNFPDHQPTTCLSGLKWKQNLAPENN